jgi:hypothetical protein
MGKRVSVLQNQLGCSDGLDLRETSDWGRLDRRKGARDLDALEATR